MVCATSCMVLSSHVTLLAGIPCMWHTVSQCFQCLHLYLSNILTPMIKASSSLFLCICSASAVEFVSAIEKEISILCFSQLFHQSLLAHF